MKTIVLDSHALLVFFERQSGWEIVTQLLTEAALGEGRLLLSIVNWGEVLYVVEREYGVARAKEIIALIDQFPITLVDADRSLTAIAAQLKARGGISYADCFAAGLAIMESAEVLTGDPEFKRVEDRVSIWWLSRPNMA